MALRSAFTSVAVAVQSAPDSWANPSSSTDLFPCSEVKPNFESILAQNPEYLGSVDRPGDFLLGEKVSVSISIPIRPPGGASPPSAGAFKLGRFLRAANFTETILSSAIPASPEAVAAATTGSITLGAGAAATADLYRGLAVLISDNGASYPRQLAAIRDYTAAKVATLAETLGYTPAANYQIPKQLAYLSGAAGDPPNLSLKIWYDKCRYDLINQVVSSAKFTFVTSTRDSTEYCKLDLTVEGDVYDWADEDAPSVGALGAIPTFKDGDMWLANKAVGGSGFNIDMGIKVGFPPNPNKAQGNDAAQITETRRTGQVNLNHNLKSVVDFRALATAQAYHALWAQYGYTAGNMVGLLVPNTRLTYPNVDNGGEFVTQTIDLLVDDPTKSVCLYFPY